MSDFLKDEILPLSRDLISEVILDKITDYLVTGKLKPGDKLPTEHEFAAIFKVGRNSIREAMRMLASLGIIEIKRGSGTFIRKSMSDSILNPLVLGLVFQQGTSAELADLRLIIESCATELVIQNASDEDLQNLEEANQKIRDAAEEGVTDSHLLRDLDIHFHFTLLEITHNFLFIKIAKTVYRLFFASLERVIELDLSNAYQNHEKYISAIRKRDSQLARMMINEGLSYWKKFVVQ